MKSNSPSSKQQGLRNVAIAVVVILVVGVGTFYGVSYISSIQPVANSSSSGTSSSVVSTATGSSESSSQASTSSGQSVGTISTSTGSSLSTVPANEFTIIGSPNVVINGTTANVTVSYSNTGTIGASVNIYVIVYYPNGTVETSGPLLYPSGPTVAPGKTFSATLDTGILSPPGTYSATFYVVEGTSGTSQQQVSSETTISFKITA
jgi:hypothetical protein